MPKWLSQSLGLLPVRQERKLSTSMREIWADPHLRNLWIDNAGHSLIDECSLASISKQCRELAKLLGASEAIDLYYRLRCYAGTVESQWRPEFVKLFAAAVRETDLPKQMSPSSESTEDYYVCPSCGAHLLKEFLPPRK